MILVQLVSYNIIIAIVIVITVSLVGKSLFNSFLTIMGAFTPNFDNSANPDFGTFLTCIFMMTCMIIMLNVLIALMGDTFSTVRSLGLAAWRQEQATVIFEQSFGLSEETLYVPPHIHILQYTSDISVAPVENKLVEMVEASKYHVTKFTELEDSENSTTGATTSAATGGVDASKLIGVTQEQLELLFTKFLETQGFQRPGSSGSGSPGKRK